MGGRGLLGKGGSQQVLLSLCSPGRRSWTPGRVGDWAPRALFPSSVDKGSTLEVSQRTGWKRKVPGLPRGQKFPLWMAAAPAGPFRSSSE